jgi:hypothetical protein
MSIYDEYRIVINAAQRRLIMRALTNAMANGRRSTDAFGPTPDEWMQLIRLFSTIKPMHAPLARASFCLTFDDSFLPPVHHGSDEQIFGVNEQMPGRRSERLSGR